MMMASAARPARGRNVLAEWAQSLTGQTAGRSRGRLRFAFYGRVSTEDWQDPVTSRARQLQQAVMLVAGHGVIVAEFFDTGESRTLPWARRPQAAALVAQLADPDRGWDAIVIGEYERAFYASQYASMAPLFEHYGVGLWMPEVGGRVDWHAEDHEQTMLALGLSSKREITRTRIRVRTAMAAQTREQGRYLGGRPPYGYRLADAGPHPNKAHAAWGRRAHRLEPDPATAPVVRWMFAQRLAGHSAARITRALNDAGIPCPSAADPRRNPHRTGAAMDAAHGGGDPGQPPLHRPAGVEPAAHRLRSGRPGQHRAGAQAGAAVEPARRLGHLRTARAPGAGQRGRLHRRPGHHRAAWPGRARPPAGTCWPGCWPAGGAGASWSQPGPTASPPTGAATATPAPPAPIWPGRRTPTSARTRSSRTWPPSPSSSTSPPIRHPARGASLANVTTPARAADLIDSLRTAGVILTYDPGQQTLRCNARHHCDHRERPLTYPEHILQKGGQKKGNDHPLRPEAGPG